MPKGKDLCGTAGPQDLPQELAHLAGETFRKALYREYTDASFTTRRMPRWGEELGCCLAVASCAWVVYWRRNRRAAQSILSLGIRFAMRWRRLHHRLNRESSCTAWLLIYPFHIAVHFSPAVAMTISWASWGRCCELRWATPFVSHSKTI